MSEELKRVEKIRNGERPSLSFSKPLEGAKLRVLSLGAGVQSSVLALMAAKGEIGPRPDYAIFADTQWEPKEVYDHLDWLESVVSNPLRVEHPFPIIRVSKGNIREDSLNGRIQIPAFAKGAGMSSRQCTRDYKIDPVTKKIRELIGLKYRQHAPKTPVVEQWLGISTDEVQRMKESRDKFIENRWPLIEEGMSRRDCLAWFARHYPERTLAKSACIGCPFHTNEEWRRIRDTDPVSWQDAVEFDKAIRSKGTLKGMNNQQYSHRSCVPLDEVDLSTAADKGQVEFGFQEECEGMCGI